MKDLKKDLAALQENQGEGLKLYLNVLLSDHALRNERAQTDKDKTGGEYTDLEQ